MCCVLVRVRRGKGKGGVRGVCGYSGRGFYGSMIFLARLLVL